MRQFLLCCLLVAGSGDLFSQNIFKRFYGRSGSSDDYARHAATAPDGGFFVTGSTATTSGNYDIFLLKTDAAGQQQWWRSYGGSADDGGLFVAATPDGGCVLGGSTASEGNGRTDGFVKKIAPDGSLEWTTLFGDTGYDEVTCVRPTADGGYVLCGTFVNNETDGQDVFIAALTPAGSIEMYETQGSPGLDRAWEVVEFATGGYLLHCYLPQGPDYGSRMVKYDANGAVLWQKSMLNDAFYLPGPAQLCAAPDGRVYFGGPGGRLVPFELDNISGLVVGLQPDGEIAWVTSVPNNHYPAFALQTTPSGELLVEAVRFHQLDSVWSPQLRCYRLGSSGALLAEDSLNLALTLPQIQQLLLGANGRPAVLSSAHFDANAQYDPGLLVTSDPFGQWDEDWFQTYSATLPNTHEVFLDAVRVGSGDFFAAASRFNPETSAFETWVLHTDAEGNPLHEIAVPTGQPYLNDFARLNPTTDHGVLLFADEAPLTNRRQVARISPAGELAWHRILTLPDSLSSYNKLRALPDGGFAMLAYGLQSNNYGPSYLVRFDADANLLWIKLLYPGHDAERQEYGQLTQMIPSGDGFVLQGRLYSAATQTYALWMVFTDADGNILREARNDGYFYQDQYLRHTADGGFLLAGSGNVATPTDDYQSVAGLVKLSASGVLEWDYDLFGESSDGEVLVGFKSVEELPCGGYVLAVSSEPAESNLPSPYRVERRLTLLHHIDLTGKGGEFFSALDNSPLPVPDFSFLPGYVYREWGGELNGVTRDLYFRRITFEEGGQPSPGEWTLGPNPSPGHVCLSLRNDYEGPVTVRVFDAAGRLLDSFDGHKHEPVWTYPYYANWPAGIYLFTIQAEKTLETVQWVKE